METGKRSQKREVCLLLPERRRTVVLFRKGNLLTNDPHGFLRQNKAGEQESTLWRFGCRGVTTASTIRLLKDLGIHGQARLQTVIETSGCCSQPLRIRREEPNWAPRCQGLTPRSDQPVVGQAY
ncbi:unnamed protein product [Pleuronectes platessa]|uniref:Uncharacterized protein n=1 Tax=Pleuronectes platessa TaxID=8262 RepID=A0A9N7YGT7_PLEPL|nr:unnamed protein product [Pleuronectes platessa]